MSAVKIFLAEDNPADVYLLREALGINEHDGVELMVVHDGEQAIDFIRRREGFESVPAPDLIVLDLNLPKSDGSEVLRQVRSSEEFRSIPVVILTSSDSPSDRACAEQLGASAYLTKPSDLDAFLALGDQLRAFVPQP